MSKGALIGKGRTAEVFEWENDKVLKLYFESFPESFIDYEAKINDEVLIENIPGERQWLLDMINSRLEA